MEDLKKLLKNGLAKKILDFFEDNPASVDSASGVAAWVHADREEVKKLLDTMVDLGVLEMDMMGGTQGYSFTREESKIRAVKKEMDSLHE